MKDVLLLDFLKQLSKQVNPRGCKLVADYNGATYIFNEINSRGIQVKYGNSLGEIGHFSRGVRVSSVSLLTVEGRSIGGTSRNNACVVINFKEPLARRW